MTDKTWVKCSIVFYYDKNTYIGELDEEPLSDEEIFLRCQKMMVEDIYDFNDPIDYSAVKAEFRQPPWEPLINIEPTND